MVYQTSYSQCLWLYLRRLMARMQKEATKVWRNYASGTKRKSSQQLTLSSSDGRSDAGRFWDSCSTLLRTSRYLSDTPTIILQACFTKATNTHGEYRAFVVTGQYEKVLPMDIYPQHLLKSILVNDYERMEGLGLLEVVEEDLALCEFVCTSKQPVQNILREGLNTLREQ